MNDRPICIYHGHCPDGFTSAWVVRRFFKGEVDFHAAAHQSDPPAIERGRIVIFTDYAYKHDVMLQLLDEWHPKGVVVLDHHKSIAEDLKEDGRYIIDMWPTLDRKPTWQHFFDHLAQDRIAGRRRIYTVFDMQRSGAGLTWDFFFPGEPRPPLLDRIEDRDLWRFRFADTRAVTASVLSYQYEFDVWDRLFATDLESLRRDGEAIERKHVRDLHELIATTRRVMAIGGYVVPAANLPYTMASDAGHILSEDYPFAACYYDTPQGRVFSLRSRPAGVDVSEIARRYGGGGHRHAAGFRVPLDRIAEFEVTA